jgi:hypothetical protein
MQPISAKLPRPRGVTAVGILAILIGLFGIAGGTVLLLNADIIFATLDALLAVVIGVLYVAAGIGFFRGKGWAWVLGIIGSIISLIVSIVEHPAAHAYGIPGTVVAAIVIYYLTRPHVKVFFGRSGKQTNFYRENEHTKI